MTDYGNACSGFDKSEIEELSGIALQYLKSGGLVVKISNTIGNKVEDLLQKVPKGLRHFLDDAADLALRTAYLTATATQASEGSESWMNRALRHFQGERWHKIASSVSGAIGGAGGVVTSVVDLAVTTTLIMRSIQQIAAGYGEDVENEQVRVQCLAVFGFGGPLTEDDEVETGLYGVRLALAGGKTLETAIKIIAPRFGIVASEKLLAQMAPVMGALAGAAINPVFTSYYQDMAHVHFRLRRLEAKHDPEQVRACFERIVLSKREAKGKKKAR